MSTEANDGKGLLIRRSWTGMPPFVHTYILTEPAERPAQIFQEPTIDQTAKNVDLERAHEIILVGENIRISEKKES